MASNCPKCDRKLKLTDMNPKCPGCNANLLYYKIEERLEVDALNAEIEHAHTQKKLDVAKASMIGSPLSIVRLVLIVLTIGALFLPLATISASGPYFDNNNTFTILSIVESLMEFDFGAFGLIGSNVLGNAVLLFAISIACVALAAVMALIQLAVSFLSCSPRGFSRNVTLASLGIVFSIAASIVFNMFLKAINEALPNFVTGSVNFGIYVVAGMFFLLLALNIYIKVKGGIKVKYKPCYIGREQILYEEFVEKYGEGSITLETVIENSDEFLASRQEVFEEVEANA